MRIKACLLAQACLLFFRPGLLPVWGDEQFTLDVCQGAFLRVAELVAADNHPPGYYWLVWVWLRLIPVADPLVAARLFSAAVMLGATWTLWHLFVRRLPDPIASRWVMLLWVLSPFALMYGRMARSYSLQLLLFLPGVYVAERALGTGRFVLPALVTAALLYVHYVPGFCLVALVAGRLLLMKRWRPLLVYAGVTAAAYSPWIAVALAAASRELTKGTYVLSGGHYAEHLLRIGYTWVVWHFGETLPLAWMAAAAPLTLFTAALAWHGARRHSGPALSFAAAAITGYLPVSRVVIFSLVPARLLFLAPFYWMLAASGRAAYPRVSAAAAAILLVLNGAAISNYFARAHFLNKGYLIPFEELAKRFQNSGSGVVLVDIDSVDTRPLWPRIPAGLRRAAAAGNPPAHWVRAGDEVVFHVRGSRDLSREGSNDALDRELARTRSCTREGFVPYSASDRWLMGVLGWAERPTHVLQLVTCRL